MRNTSDGSGTENSAEKSHSPRSMNASMRSCTREATGPSSAAMWRGAKSGSRILRYFTWSGGSICSGINGRTVPMCSVASVAADENTFGRRKHSCAASLVVRM